MAILKVCPAVLRWANGAREILVFTHPLAGVQVVKGTIEAGEDVEAAGRRELSEEAGVEGLPLLGTLAASYRIAPGQLWHFLLLSGEGLPERWAHHCADDGGHDFAFFWHRLDYSPDDRWHEIFKHALAHIKAGAADQPPFAGRT
ncbi:NUDIX domain-containing protein [Pelagibacterium sp. 26DY04]|uniref:NUDIX hydrolase n=1 Tax=Pelagibacterium sp. 26DY04 TaxID=2967130 RepID=UPI00281698D1|nr:NUDIX domain-containing protein [Pelagibacterium sp. 26DY04]WMT86713.1 NUDIX domain-containing protein [Pelagibacterium sp. 26DY04]